MRRGRNIACLRTRRGRALEDGSSTNSVMRRLCNYCILFHRITCGFKSLSQDTDTEMMAAQTLRTQWHSSRGGKDVSGGYRDAVLNLVSFTDPKLGLPQQDGENANVEDFLWQKLCFVLRPISRRDRSLNSDGVLASRGNNTTDEFSLRHWANVVINAESSFVEGGKSPFVYFRALLYVVVLELFLSLSLLNSLTQIKHTRTDTFWNSNEQSHFLQLLHPVQILTRTRSRGLRMLYILLLRYIITVHCVSQTMYRHRTPHPRRHILWYNNRPKKRV